ncbi:hypothetical protein HanIR_Chr08g0345031 [Helianthus annuus]|nr:hypothetical protein HanIR_Chr08g0345031 [Helianthus annuus]
MPLLSFKLVESIPIHKPNAATDDLDAMWVCLRENCVNDDATGAEKLSTSSQCHIFSSSFVFLDLIHVFF